MVTSCKGDEVKSLDEPRRLRVLVIHTALAAYRIDLFNRLAAEFDFEVVFHRQQILYHRDVRQDSLRTRLTCRFSDLRGNLVLCGRDLTWGVPRLLQDRRPDVVVTDEFAISSLLVFMFRRLSRGTLGHVIWSDESVHSLTGRGRVSTFLRRFFAQRIDGLLVCSLAVGDAFVRLFSYDRHRISVCGVHQEPEALRQRLTAAESTAVDHLARHQLRTRRIVLYVGRLAPEKNLPFALTAFGQVFGDDASVALVLVGSGPERKALERQAAELGLAAQVVFAGHCEGPELLAWYRLASVLLLPSRYEPYGAVINESLVFGVPVLCTDVAGAAHLVREGCNGYLFSPEIAAQLEECLKRSETWLRSAGDLVAESRPNMMPVAFQDDVEGFVRVVQLAARAGAGQSCPQT